MPNNKEELHLEEENTLSHLKSDDMYINLSKLLLIADDPKIHFADLQKPDEKTKKRLERIINDMVSVAEGFLSDDQNVMDESNRKYQQIYERSRSVIMDLDLQKEAMYALGQDPEKLSQEERKTFMDDTKNADKLSTLFGEISECIQKADATGLLSEIQVDGKTERISQILDKAGETKALSETYKDRAKEWESKQKSNEKERVEEKIKKEEPLKERETKEKAQKHEVAEEKLDQDAFEEKAEEMELEDTKEESSKTTGKLHAARAPKIKSVSGLSTWERIVNWLLRKLGLGGKVSEKSKKEQTAEKSVQEESELDFDLEHEKAEKTQGLKQKEVQKEQKKEQEKQSEPFYGQSAVVTQDSETKEYDKTIRELQIENLRKDSMIKYLQAELLKAQIREQNLKNEKLAREIYADQIKTMVDAMKGSAEQTKEAKTKEEKKAAVEKISFKQLSKEEADVEKKHPKLEALKENEKKRAKDDSMIANHRPLEKGGKKAPGRVL